MRLKGHKTTGMPADIHRNKPSRSLGMKRKDIKQTSNACRYSLKARPLTTLELRRKGHTKTRNACRQSQK